MECQSIFWHCFADRLADDGIGNSIQESNGDTNISLIMDSNFICSISRADDPITSTRDDLIKHFDLSEIEQHSSANTDIHVLAGTTFVLPRLICR